MLSAIVMFCLSYLIWFTMASSEVSNVKLQSTIIDLNGRLVPLELTWRSSGSCPPSPHGKVCEWITSQSFIQNLAWISALPNNGIEFVRVHWLLSSISINKLQDLNVTYNFTCLDKFFERLHFYGLIPIFEIMGNPSNFFYDFENKTQLLIWNELVFTLATRYLKKFGLEYLMRWMFETWNEPKAIHFDSIKMSVQGFLNYYDATSDGLKRGHDLLRLVTPGGACPGEFDLRSYCWFLLQHIQNGKSIFRSRTIFPDLISIHEKGIFPNSSAIILKREINFIKILSEHMTKFKGMKIINDEADPQVSWNVSRIWQADTSYAAIMVKIICDHIHHDHHHHQHRISMLSNDNAFLSFHPFPFTQRTLLARFQVNTTSPPHVQFIRKASYIVLGFLSFLGEKVIQVKDGDSISHIITIHGEKIEDKCWYLSLIVSRFDTSYNHSVNHTIHFDNLPIELHPKMRFIIYHMDDVVSNPYKIWTGAGSPQTPSKSLFRKMRDHEEPKIRIPPSDWTQGSSGNITMEMSPISIGLIQICSLTCSVPGQVVNVQVMNVTYNHVIIFWSDSEIKTKCLFNYEVEHSKDGHTFMKLNEKPTIFNSFVFDAERLLNRSAKHEETIGYYRIRAVDLWDRCGKYSVIHKYPEM